MDPEIPINEDDVIHYVINVPQPVYDPSARPPLLASSATAEQRIAVCKQCPNFVRLTKQCSICNCLMPIKVRFERAQCPDKRW